jgi:hypothetical protein
MKNALAPAFLALAFATLGTAQTQTAKPLSVASEQVASSPEYHKYIDPLLDVKDFRMYYYEDGASDASVLFPSKEGIPYGRPVEPLISLVRLREKSFPLLIDCLNDRRVTSVRFDGNRITKPMNVPLGYVCLDILMFTASGRVSDPQCADDGLGACMNDGFYFRPDDYANCWEQECRLRPWVTVVQRNWKKELFARRLRFVNPYDKLKVDEYKDLGTPKQ